MAARPPRPHVLLSCHHIVTPTVLIRQHRVKDSQRVYIQNGRDGDMFSRPHSLCLLDQASPTSSQGLNSDRCDMSRHDGGHSRPGPENLPDNIPSWLDMESPAENSGTTELADSRSLNHNRRRVTQSAMLALDWIGLL